jgi:hypothetical protein
VPSLPFRIRLGDPRAGLPQSEAQFPKQVLAPAHAHRNAKATLDPGAERLAVPEIAAQPILFRVAAQRRIHLLELLLTHAPGAPWPLAFQQTSKPLCFEAAHPIVHGPGSIPE